MNDTSSAKAPVWFIIVSAIMLLWNLFGLAVFIMAIAIFNSKEALAEAGLNEAQVELTLATPTWVPRSRDLKL